MYRKIFLCFCKSILFCYWHNFLDLGQREVLLQDTHFSRSSGKFALQFSTLLLTSTMTTSAIPTMAIFIDEVALIKIILEFLESRYVIVLFRPHLMLKNVLIFKIYF